MLPVGGGEGMSARLFTNQQLGESKVTLNSRLANVQNILGGTKENPVSFSAQHERHRSPKELHGEALQIVCA